MLRVIKPAGTVGDKAPGAHLRQTIGQRVDVAVDAVDGRVNDGAAALVVASRAWGERNGRKPIANVAAPMSVMGGVWTNAASLATRRTTVADPISGSREATTSRNQKVRVLNR